MTNKELDDYMKTVNPNFDSHIEKGTIEMSNEYYNLLEEKMARLINENQELKKQVEQYKGSHYCSFIDICKSTKIANYTQQKEFIKYLEDEIKFIENKVFSFPCPSNERNYLIRIENKLIKVLQKYEKIVNGTE